MADVRLVVCSLFQTDSRTLIQITSLCTQIIAVYDLNVGTNWYLELWSMAGGTPGGLWNKIWYCVIGGQEFLFVVPLLNSLEYLQQIICGFGDGAKGSHTIEEMQSRCLSWISTCTFHFGMTPMSKRSALPLEYRPCCSADAYIYNVQFCSWR